MDMLVKLYSLSDVDTYAASVSIGSIEIRRAMAHERDVVIGWVRHNFEKEQRAWGSEVAAAFSRTPSGCHIAVKGGGILGFACHDVTAKGYFGPMGVAESSRCIGIGAALLRVTLRAMAAEGYGYSIIGGVSEAGLGFYRKVVDATEITDSTPGIYPSNPLIH